MRIWWLALLPQWRFHRGESSCANMGELWANEGIGGFSGQTDLRNPNLHDINTGGMTASIEGMVCSGFVSGSLVSLKDERSEERMLSTTPFVFWSVVVLAFIGAWCRYLIRSQLRSTAITMSAPIARHSETGTGLTKPPSTILKGR